MDLPHRLPIADDQTLIHWIAAAYDRQAADYDKGFRHLQYPKFEALLQHTAIRRLLYNRVLDLGCGTGLLGDYCVDQLGVAPPHFSHWLGVDLSLRMLEIAKTRGLSPMRACSTMLPFASGVFDVVCAFTSLGLTRALPRELAEAVRVLAPGGFLVLSILPDAEAEMPRALHNLPLKQIRQTVCGQDYGYLFERTNDAEAL